MFYLEIIQAYIKKEQQGNGGNFHSEDRCDENIFNYNGQQMDHLATDCGDRTLSDGFEFSTILSMLKDDYPLCNSMDINQQDLVMHNNPPQNSHQASVNTVSTYCKI